MIKKTSELVLVEVGANAHFECLVDANPVNEQVITWKRRKNDSESSVPSSSSSSSSSYDKSDDSEESSSSSSVFNRMRTDVEVFNQGEENGGVFSSNFGGGVPLKGTLVVLNASLADSGTSFDCLADNGVGKRSKATMTLLVLRKFLFALAFFCFVQSFAIVLFHMQMVDCWQQHLVLAVLVARFHRSKFCPREYVVWLLLLPSLHLHWRQQILLDSL